jgi:putative endonuclease
MQAVKTALLTRSVTLYTGVTGDIFHRALEHKAGEIEGFMKKYHINRLVYYETFKYVNNALAREKQVKAGTRAKRAALIKTTPAWQDLAEGWGEQTELQIPRHARDDNSKEIMTGFNISIETSDGAAKASPLQSEIGVTTLQGKAKTA